MDQDITFYLAKFSQEEKTLSEARQKREEWAEKETRSNAKIKSLLQLLTARAQEIDHPLPKDIISKATTFFGGQVTGNLKSTDDPGHADSIKVGERTDGDQSGTLVQPVSRNGDTSEVNVQEWIGAAVAASGSAGILPTEIRAKADRDGVKMHQNYVYVALKKLSDKKHIHKQGGRYFGGQS
jgi:hypothetical protein